MAEAFGDNDLLRTQLDPGSKLAFGSTPVAEVASLRRERARSSFTQRHFEPQRGEQ